ncbi:hypothetical protein DH2020_039087 [Rehmannia glutinosa]|uniref:Uncharacterized protein n=1 Tax=Rehmannia glutinosa TaxID=99300 RepID=A0ABR0UXX3_REHGL
MDTFRTGKCDIENEFHDCFLITGSVVPNTPVESHEKVRTIQNLNIPEIYELDHDTSSSINSPFSPDFISMPSSSSASEEARSHVDMQTILKRQMRSRKSTKGYCPNYVGESSSSADRAETSTTEVVEVVNSVEVNEIENPTDLENSRDEIDVYDEDMKCIEPQISQNNSDEHIDTSNREFDEKDGQDSTSERKSEEETLSEENKSYQDNNSLPEKAESTSVETEVPVERAEVSHNDQVYMETASGMPQLEARTREDIDVVFKQFRDEEIEKPVISEPPQVELTSESENEVDIQSTEDVDSLPKKAGLTSAETEAGQVHMESASEMPEVEARTVEDIDAVYKQFSDKGIEKPVIPEPPQVEHSELGTPILEVRSVEEDTSDNDRVYDGSIEIHRIPDSVDSGETRGTLELHVVETIPSEGTSLPPKNALDDNSEEKDVKPNPDDGSVEVESSVKLDHEVKAPEELHSTTYVKEKGNTSKSSGSSSSSSSSSSSESSSSDSEKE